MDTKLWILIFVAFSALTPELGVAGDTLFQSHHQVVNLGSLGGVGSSALAINDSDVVVG